MKPELSSAQRAAVMDELEPLSQWARRCHGASIAIVNAEIFPVARVARGFTEGVTGQHSWVVLGDDCYDPKLTIVDPTLWSYDDAVQGIWVGRRMGKSSHVPHGAGSIWEWGRPVSGGEEIMKLEPREPFSEQALRFLELLGPLDRQGWARLANAPVEGWPAAEIMPAINDTIGPLVPIDIIGMLTDRNPAGLYLPGDEKD
jgi:hypothetical protein